MFKSPAIQKSLLFFAVLCVVIVSLFDSLPWIISQFGYHGWYNSQMRDFYQTSNLYWLLPVLGTLALIPLLIQRVKRPLYWILLGLLWFMFLVILVLSILIMARLIPGAP